MSLLNINLGELFTEIFVYEGSLTDFITGSIIVLGIALIIYLFHPVFFPKEIKQPIAFSQPKPKLPIVPKPQKQKKIITRRIFSDQCGMTYNNEEGAIKGARVCSLRKIGIPNPSNSLLKGVDYTKKIFN